MQREYPTFSLDRLNLVAEMAFKLHFEFSDSQCRWHLS